MATAITIERKDELSVYTVRGATGELTLPIQYALGVHMQTFVFRYKERFYESIISYYPKLQALAVTLGDEERRPRNLVEAIGREISNQEVISCFGCHGTGGVSDGKVNLHSLQPGVTCVHCHMEAQTHMEAAAHGKTTPLPASLGKLGAEDMSIFCGQCHRTWEAVVRARQWGPVNVRFQPYRLANSECFLGEDKRIRCTACHDPHSKLAQDEAGYDAKCLACHNANPFKSCPVAQSKCVSCHMPKVPLSEGHVTFTDHQIRIFRPGDPYPN